MTFEKCWLKHYCYFHKKNKNSVKIQPLYHGLKSWRNSGNNSKKFNLLELLLVQNVRKWPFPKIDFGTYQLILHALFRY